MSDIVGWEILPRVEQEYKQVPQHSGISLCDRFCLHPPGSLYIKGVYETIKSYHEA